MSEGSCLITFTCPGCSVDVVMRCTGADHRGLRDHTEHGDDCPMGDDE